MDIPFPNKKYQIVYADPPWSYKDKMHGHSFSLDHEYKTQSQQWIARLPVREIAEKDSVLFLWAVSPLLDEAIGVMNDWGFKYKTLAFCWSKETRNRKKVSNLGRWTMGNVELCLLGVKGKPRRVCRNVKQLVIAERTRHSAKPNEVRRRIVELMGDLPRIELFARQRVEGWDAWGDEVDSAPVLPDHRLSFD
jgi:site-specific DNA-methyltransferase (adenine-specific)